MTIRARRHKIRLAADIIWRISYEARTIDDDGEIICPLRVGGVDIAACVTDALGIAATSPAERTRKQQQA